MLSEEDLSCPICQEFFKDPVVLSCSHSFCKDCLRSWWREKPTQDCPVCKRRSSRSDPPRNLALRNLCEAYVQQREKKEERQTASEEQLCQVHSEKLKLFCLTDQQPVCVVCRDSKVHEGHRFRPIVEAAQDLREELDKSLLPLKENLQKAKDFKEEFEKIVCKIKDQFNETERQIHDQFEKLHQCLVEEEESRIKALREEEEQKTWTMKDKMAAVSREIEALSESIRATEEQLRAPDTSFLIKYKAAVERVQRCPLLEEEPQLGPESLIDLAKHLGNLTFNIWTSIKRLVHPCVILDPNRVINAVVSDDLTSFIIALEEANEESSDQKSSDDESSDDKSSDDKSSDNESSDDKSSDNESSDDESSDCPVGIVFGSEWFDSGSHRWDVEVGDNDNWELGVVTDLLEVAFKDEDPERWGLQFSDGEYKADTHNEKDISLKLDSNPVKIRIHLNCIKHEVSFYDLDTNTHIHTFTQISQKKLFPWFCNGSKRPIKILPHI